MTPRFTSRQLARAFCASVAALAAASATPALAQEKPSGGAVELIVPFGTGGGADQLARESAKLLAGVLPAPVTVTNVPGATGNTGIAKLIAAPNDGNTMAVLTGDTFFAAGLSESGLENGRYRSSRHHDEAACGAFSACKQPLQNLG